MTCLKLHWICLVVLTLSAVSWYCYVTRSDGLPFTSDNGLQGYVRIAPGHSEKLLRMHCAECALVSSSGQMLGANAGAEIDQLGCVIRMNNAPTLGYERDVGARTSLRVVSHTSVRQLLRNQTYFFRTMEDTAYVIWGPDRNMRQDGKGRVFNALEKVARLYPRAKIYTMTREKIQYCDGVFQNETGKNRMKSGAFLSTGFFTMVLAMDMCDTIQIYGMINNNYCSRVKTTGVPYHYYEPGRMDECRTYRAHEQARRGGHRFITEKAIFARWASQHRMTFTHPSWSQAEQPQ